MRHLAIAFTILSHVFDTLLQMFVEFHEESVYCGQTVGSSGKSWHLASFDKWISYYTDKTVECNVIADVMCLSERKMDNAWQLERS